jgi:Glycosyltransferase family 87
VSNSVGGTAAVAGLRNDEHKMQTRVEHARRFATFAGLSIVCAWLLYGVARRIGGGLGPSPVDRFHDFYEFFEAARALTTGQDIYSVGHFGYIYPPLLAFVLTPLAWLRIEAAAWIWSAVHFALLGTSVFLIAREALRRLGRPSDLATLAAVGLLAILVCVDKLRTEMNMQQSNLLVLLSFGLGLLWLDRRPLLAGLVLGFAANIKYLTLITLPYLVLRRRWRAAGSLVVSTVAWAMLPAVYIGWTRNLEYLGKAIGGLGHLAGGGQMDGSVAKVMDPSFGWSIPTSAAILFGADRHTLLSVGFIVLAAVAFALVCWALFQRAGVPMLSGRGGLAESRQPLLAVVAIEWAGLVVVALAFGPQTNSPHLSVLLLPCIVAVAVVGLPDRGRPATPLILGLIFLAAGLCLPPGGSHFGALIGVWRMVAGPSWCALVMYSTMLLVGLPRVYRTRPAKDGGHQR